MSFSIFLRGGALLVMMGQQTRSESPFYCFQIESHALVVLTGTTKWSRVRLYIDRLTAAVAAAKSGTYAEVEIPFE